MSLNPVTNSLNGYKPSQSIFAYSSDCPICLTSNQDLFSFHLSTQERYSEKNHGAIQIRGTLKGVTKIIELEKNEEDSSKKVAASIFCQVGKNKKDKQLYLYSPLHNACTTCISKVQAICPYKCPICRQKITVLPAENLALPSPHLRVPSLVRVNPTYLNEDFLDYVDYSLTNIKSRGNKGFEDISRSKKKACLNRVVKSYKQFSASQYAISEDLDEDV
jgi:hypothetical protein